MKKDMKNNLVGSIHLFSCFVLYPCCVRPLEFKVVSVLLFLHVSQDTVCFSTQLVGISHFQYVNSEVKYRTWTSKVPKVKDSVLSEVGLYLKLNFFCVLANVEIDIGFV